MNAASSRHASRKICSSALVEGEDVHQNDGGGINADLPLYKVSLFSRPIPITGGRSWSC